jgi:hypothetical protein
MAERERIVKGMKKNLAGFKARYGDRAKEVMYATATKQAMKEETVEEAMSKADVPAYLRKQKGEKPLTMADVKAAPKDSISHPDNLAKARGVKEEAEQIDELTDDQISKLHNDAAAHMKKSMDKASDARIAAHKNPPAKKGFMARVGQKQINMVKGAYHGLTKEEVEELDEKSEQAKRNKMMKNTMSASKGARINLGLKLDPAEYGYKRAQHLNTAIGRAAMKAEEVELEEAKKEDVPFDGPYTKTKPAKNSDGTAQSPMSRARALAKDAMKKQMKEDIDRLFEKDDSEYNYEGEMAVTQLKTIMRHAEALQAKLQPDTNLPEWVQSKITLATDYMQTAHDYLMSELEEQAPVASEEMKEHFDSDGNIINNKVSYKEFAMMLEYETKDGRYVHKGSYGGTYVDPEGADDADDKKPKQQPAEKRGRGRPAGAKSGARKITGTSKLFK